MGKYFGTDGFRGEANVNPVSYTHLAHHGDVHKTMKKH